MQCFALQFDSVYIQLDLIRYGGLESVDCLQKWFYDVVTVMGFGLGYLSFSFEFNLTYYDKTKPYRTCYVVGCS